MAQTTHFIHRFGSNTYWGCSRIVQHDAPLFQATKQQAVMLGIENIGSTILMISESIHYGHRFKWLKHIRDILNKIGEVKSK